MQEMTGWVLREAYETVPFAVGLSDVRVLLSTLALAVRLLLEASAASACLPAKCGVG